MVLRMRLLHRWQVFADVCSHYVEEKFSGGTDVGTEIEKLVEQVNKLSIEEVKEEVKEEEKQLSFDKIVSNLKAGQYTNILVLTGAGISVSAGIPDY